MGAVDNFNKKLENLNEQRKARNSWQARYEKLKNTEYNQNARKNYEKMCATTYAGQELSEAQEAIIFSQAYHQLLLKNPAGSKYPEFDEYAVTKTEGTYIVNGYCDSSNSYGAQVREKHSYELCKINGEWTCVTDVGANALKWIIFVAILIALPSIISYCSLAAM